MTLQIMMQICVAYVVLVLAKNGASESVSVEFSSKKYYDLVAI
jgi:hypothetical protein